LGRNFGFKVNTDAFERLVRELPLKLLLKHKNNLFQMEALLFGCAGMLDAAFEDEYPKKLQKEFMFLKSKYGLNSIDPTAWKLLRLRPGNFPAYRLSQFAALIFRREQLFSSILALRDLKSAMGFFETEASEYWKDHYLFDRKSPKKAVRRLGADSRMNLVINTAAPLLFSYGHLKNQSAYKDAALKLLEETKPEDNHISRKWTELGMENSNASQSQALIQLRDGYCEQKACLHCGIGAAILRKKG
jgi:hypothetical protein